MSKCDLNTTMAERCKQLGKGLDVVRKKIGKSLTAEALNKQLGLGVNFWRAVMRVGNE